MIWFLYNILFTVVYLLMMPKFISRMLKRGGYGAGFMQRFGVYDKETLVKIGDGGKLWIHAVSVGEVYIALRFMESIRAAESDVSFVLTTTTSTGHKIASKEIADEDVLLYFPADFPFAVRRVVRRLKPRALILTENELWPNLLRYVKKSEVPVILINGRISDSSFKGYSKLRLITHRALQFVDLFLVQTLLDKERLCNLGAPTERVEITGSAKYDVVKTDPDSEKRARETMESAGIAVEDLVLLGGSTWPGEEKVLLEIYKNLKPGLANLKLVLVPRHAERRAEVEADIKSLDLKHTRRSELGQKSVKLHDILLVDTTGELKDLYSVASVIFVGKSLCSTGGQNIIEPALPGKPIVVGPHLENFPDVAKDFTEANAMIQVADAKELEGALKKMLESSQLREEYGARARLLVPAKRGVVDASVKMILETVEANVNAHVEN